MLHLPDPRRRLNVERRHRALDQLHVRSGEPRGRRGAKAVAATKAALKVAKFDVALAEFVCDHRSDGCRLLLKLDPAVGGLGFIKDAEPLHVDWQPLVLLFRVRVGHLGWALHSYWLGLGGEHIFLGAREPGEQPAFRLLPTSLLLMLRCERIFFSITGL